MKHTSQFVITRPRPAAASRLFCFPHAGGGPVAFFEWSQRLDPAVECVSLLYAGRGPRLREKPSVRVEDLVGEIAAGLAKFSDKPFAFYGHSFGGIVAFELARTLRRSGLPGPEHLFVGAARPPHMELPFSPIHAAPDEEFIASVQARYGGMPAAILQDPEILDMFLPPMRADFTAYETYRFQPGDPLDIPITAFGGADDTAVKVETLREWSLHTAASFDMNVLPGGHFFPTTSGKQLIEAVQVRMDARPQHQNSTSIF